MAKQTKLHDIHVFFQKTGLLLCLPAFLSLGITQTGMHPAYSTENLKLDKSGLDLKAEKGITGLDFLSDGRMVVCTWGGNKGSTPSKGKVFLLDNVTGNSSKDITAKEIVNSLVDPVGMRVVDDVIYVSHKPGIVKIETNGNKNSISEVYWDKNYHEYHFGLVHKKGFLYSGLGQPWSPFAAPQRGGFVKTNISNGASEFIAGGLREPNGVGLGPAGEIFVSDNQGHYLPSSKLVHIKQGAFYGFVNDKGPFNGAIDKQQAPVVWTPHSILANSPTEPIFVTSGVFAGQMFLGDHTKCRLMRVFLERINGEWQGAVFKMVESNGLISGPNRFVWGPDSALYIGGVGKVNDWACACGVNFGIQQLTPTGKPGFDILAVRSLEDGFELEFSKPVGKEAEDKNNYAIRRWGFQPERGYGKGNMKNGSKIAVQSVSLNQSGARVKIQINAGDLVHGSGLLPSTVFYFQLKNIKSGSETLWTNEAWYTLNTKGPAEKLGCKDKKYAEYDNTAGYDDGLQCKTEATNQVIIKKNLFSISSNPNGPVSIQIPAGKDGLVEITDLKGKLMVSNRSLSSATALSVKQWPKGLYMVRLTIGGKADTEVFPVY